MSNHYVERNVKMPNLLTGLLGRLKKFIFPQAAAKKAFDVDSAVSQTMEQNINLWYSMYVNQPPWANKFTPIGLPAAICREIARPVLSELTVNITGSKRADYLQEQYNVASKNFIRQLELGLAVGGVAFKPYLNGTCVLVDATSAAAFQPTKFEPNGTCSGGVFREKLREKGRCYVRLEYHDLDGDTYTVRNKAYQSDSNGSVGDEISLQSVSAWARIEPEIVIQGVEKPLFSYFKPPHSNNVETDSLAGMSIYGGSVADLIKQADEQWDILRWEYRSGQRKILMDGTETRAKDFDKRLFEIGPFSRDGNFYKEFDPPFRDEAIYRGLQNILKQIEFEVGLSFGTISDPQDVEKSATEIRNSKWRMFVTIGSIQTALEHVFDTLVYAIDVYATLYGLAPVGDYEVSYDWGDSILDDADSKERERANDRQDLANGTLNDWEYRSKYRHEDEDTAKRMLPGLENMTTEEEDEVE